MIPMLYVWTLSKWFWNNFLEFGNNIFLSSVFQAPQMMLPIESINPNHQDAVDEKMHQEDVNWKLKLPETNEFDVTSANSHQDAVTSKVGS